MVGYGWDWYLQASLHDEESLEKVLEAVVLKPVLGGRGKSREAGLGKPNLGP